MGKLTFHQNKHREFEFPNFGSCAPRDLDHFTNYVREAQIDLAEIAAARTSIPIVKREGQRRKYPFTQWYDCSHPIREAIARVRDRGDDLFYAWLEYSDELVDTVGFDEIKKLFELFKRFPSLTYPVSPPELPDELCGTFKIFRGSSEKDVNDGRLGLFWWFQENNAEGSAYRYDDGLVLARDVTLEDIAYFDPEGIMVVMVEPEPFSVISRAPY
jgi:hypothetical protein